MFPYVELCYIPAMVLLNKNILARLLSESKGAVTAVSLWADDIQRAQWRNREDVLEAYPQTKFVAGSMATFAIDAARYSVTAQIAFNTSVVIVLAATPTAN